MKTMLHQLRTGARLRRPALAVLAAALLAVVPAQAITVFDPVNLVQNTVSALTAVRNEVNTARSYVQHMQQTLGMLRSLAKVENLAELAGVERELALYKALAGSDTQLGSLMDRSLQLSRDIQAEYGASGQNWENFVKQRAAISQERMQIVAGHYQNLNKAMGEIAERRKQIVNQLKDSEGPTSALQNVGAAIDTLIGQNQLLIATLTVQGKAQVAAESTRADTNEGDTRRWNERQRRIQESNAALKK